MADTIKTNNVQTSRCFDQIDESFNRMELRLDTRKEEVGELRAALDLLSSQLGMLEESSAKKDERIRELELQVEHLNDRDAEVTVSLCEFNSFLIKHNLHVDEFEEKMEVAVENLQESVQENRSMVEVHYEQSVNWRRSWINIHSGHWGQIRPGKCLDYDPIRSKFSRISMTVLVFKILM